MSDISNQLIAEIKTDFNISYINDDEISRLLKLIKDSQTTFHEANQYAVSVGDLLSKVFLRQISTENLPNGKMYYNIAKKVVEPMLIQNFDLISDFSTETQAVLNAQANIGIVGLSPKLNQDRVDGIVQKLVDYDNFDDARWMLGEPIINFSQSIIDDAIRLNAQFHYDSGLRPKIVRTAYPDCCDWCNEVVGTYDYDKVSDTGNNIFRRHRHCRCEVDYLPGDGKRQNVHTKIWN